jgi:16S rRNA processing protein RimM
MTDETSASKPSKPKTQRPPRPQPPMDIRPRLADVAPDGYLAVGRVVGVHGMQGELKVESFTDFPERFDPDSLLLLGDDLEEVTVLASRPHKGNILLQLSTIRHRSDAELLRGQWLYVSEDEAIALDEDRYWVHDILGMTVVSDTGEDLGTVYDVLFTGANEVYVVRSAKPAREILLPATDEVVRAVDVANRRMTVHLIPGLVD